MKILISGSHGLVGSAMVSWFQRYGNVVARLVRSSAAVHEPDLFWNPAAGLLDERLIESFDAVIHLAGENLAAGRWTAARKAGIRDSRVKSTQLLADALTKASQPPKVFLCASAIGIYGDRGNQLLTEGSPLGDGFLASVCKEWEGAAQQASRAGIRVVHLRFGVIFSASGGALRKMLKPFQFCLGGVIGTGAQYWSWIALDDVVGAIEHVLATESMSGPVNIVSPQPVTNREFTEALGRVLRRPTLLSVPQFVARLAFGEMADEALLASQRVAPTKLLNSGYHFRYPVLEDTLRRALGAADKQNPAIRPNRSDANSGKTTK